MSPRRTRFWHPFANMAEVAEAEITIARGEGAWVWDAAGNRYLDANAGLWYCNVGHGRAELAEAAARQMRTLAAYSAFGPFASPPAQELAERVSALVPVDDAAVFFTSGGSESVDTAAKLVRRYWDVTGQPARQAIVVRENAYHGMAAYGTSLAGIAANAAGYGDLVPHTLKVPHDDPAALEAVLGANPGTVAAFFGEPVIGAGGVIPPPAGYWPEVQRICRDHDVLFVADEVVTGFGRLGRWFGSERYDVRPDIITGAKGITSGYLPLGFVAVGARVREPFWNGSAGMFRHGFTYSGHATACAVGLANLALLERERLVERVAGLEPVLARLVKPLEDQPLVAEVRSAGLLAGIQLSAAAVAADPPLPDRVVALLRDRGVLLRAIAGPSLQVSPPFVVEEDQLRLLVDAIADSLEAAGSGRA